MRRIVLSAVVTAGALAFAAADGAATEPATWVVDRHGVECANADFDSIQAAVDWAQPGDLIRVCPDLYTESVVVDKPLTLKADPDAVDAVDCFASTLTLDPTQHAIVDPPGNTGLAEDAFGFKLLADGITVSGFVVQDAWVGVDVSDEVSGHRISHNLIRANQYFGVEFGSNGETPSRVDHNCFRENPLGGLGSELDNPYVADFRDPANRTLDNARYLGNARIDHNRTFRNFEALMAIGPGERDRVTFDHNVSVDDRFGIAISNSSASAIVDNELTAPDLWPVRPGNVTEPIVIGGQNQGLQVHANRVTGGRAGITFQAQRFLDIFSAPTSEAVVTDNVVTGSTRTGIAIAPLGTLAVPSLVDSLVAGNTSNGNGFHGIFLGSGGGNTFFANVADANGGNGIYAFAGTTGNVFTQNSMHGNGWNPVILLPVMTNPKVDARDDNRPHNTWSGNQCATDSPDGTICGIG
jgi:parallel beta-helix repeat protein